eukprot:gb/GECH01010329.1/.p1 GENE.gb/GECH01010329.1/~~gb/GECH01010329.1/.p1  ORF type:complete len:170 (+),score=21.86 gb/GECH01010329.1/:1-510(+)
MDPVLTKRIYRHIDNQIDAASDDDMLDLAVSLFSNEQITIGVAGCRYLADRLKHEKHSFTSIDVSCNTIGDRGCQYLCEALQQNNDNAVEHIDLCLNMIEEDGCRYLRNMLHHNHTVTSLNLQRNHIGDQGCQELCRAISHNNTSLHDLNISGRAFPIFFFFVFFFFSK